MNRPCLEPGCTELTTRTRCAFHQRMRQQRIDDQRGSPAQRGYGPPWQRARKAVLRLQPYCVDCGSEGTKGNPLTVDHIVPLSRGGTQDEDNLQTRCRICNSSKGAR